MLIRKDKFSSVPIAGGAWGGGQVSVLYVILLLFKADVTIYFPFLLWFDLASVDSPVHMVPDGYDRNYFPQLL